MSRSTRKSQDTAYQTAAYKPWAYKGFLRGFRWAYKRRGLFPTGLITEIKKTRFETSYSSVDRKYVFRLLVLTYASKRHNKSNPFQGKLEGGLYPGSGGCFSIMGFIFWFTGRWAKKAGGLNYQWQFTVLS